MNDILTKVCFKCNTKKQISEFYKHPNMSLGVVNKCKECNKIDVKKDYYRNSQSKEWNEKEKERQREKYLRLDYKEKQKEWNLKRPHCLTGKYTNLSRKLKTEKGIELHHWNYNDDFIEDVFFLKIKEHRQSHTFLIKKDNIFTDLNGNILDTREKHLNYLISKGIKF